jgi:hypothetical protein
VDNVRLRWVRLGDVTPAVYELLLITADHQYTMGTVRYHAASGAWEAYTGSGVRLHRNGKAEVVQQLRRWAEARIEAEQRERAWKQDRERAAQEER